MTVLYSYKEVTKKKLINWLTATNASRETRQTSIPVQQNPAAEHVSIDPTLNLSNWATPYYIKWTLCAIDSFPFNSVMGFRKVLAMNYTKCGIME